MAKQNPPATKLGGRNNQDLVIVGCKIPTGLQLQVGEEVHLLKGPAKYFTPNLLKPTNQPVIHAAGLTAVPKAFWMAWLAKFKDRAFVKKGFVFAQDTQESVIDEALDHSKDITGLEALKPMEQSSVPNVLTTADNMKFPQEAAQLPLL